jgi:hypothetical protein
LKTLLLKKHMRNERMKGFTPELACVLANFKGLCRYIRRLRVFLPINLFDENYISGYQLMLINCVSMQEEFK